MAHALTTDKFQMTIRLSIIFISVLLHSCRTAYEGEVSITSRTAYQEFPTENLVDINLNSTWRKIELKGDSTKEYSGLILANKSDEFLIVEHSRSKIPPVGRTIEGDIVKMNLNGEVIEKLFDCEWGEITGNLALTKDDSKLLFTLSRDSYNPSNPIADLNHPTNVYIMDYKTKRITKTIDTLGLSFFVWINNRPWLSDGTGFIYDFRTDRQFKMANDTYLSPKEQSGIYVYDLTTDRQTLLIAEGYSGEVSPTADKIAFLKDKKICVYDMTTKVTEVLYSLKSNERTAYIEWAPDGQYVFFKRFKGHFPTRTLIRLKDKKLMKIKDDDLFKLNDV